MHSPLPDASALEAGIIDDEVPSRLSRVQENVRILLANSRLGSPLNTPPLSPVRSYGPYQANAPHVLATPPESPFRRASRQVPEVIPSPSTESTASAASSSSPSTEDDDVSELREPPRSYRSAIQRLAHQSTVFNTRAVAALNHPDLTDPSMMVLVRRKAETRQQKAWRVKKKRRRDTAVVVGSSQVFLCVFAALLLAATVATYVVLATNSSGITPTFHVLFILGIILATIVFAHSLIRVFLYSGRSSKTTVLVRSKPRHRRREHHRPREMTSLSNETTAFVPATPIRVHMPTDEVRPDSREAQPTATVDLNQPAIDWDKDIESLPIPPPAYGRWRGSVRANPDFLHWQPVVSPVDVEVPDLPSPTYEEAVAADRSGPPSYVTRDSPARRREVREAASEANRMQSQVVEPEMVEVRGIGVGLAL